MSDKYNQLPDQLLTHLRGKFSIHPLDGGCVIVTPFRHFDMSYIEIYVELSSKGYYLSDGGETLNMLFVSGITIEDKPDLMEQAERIAIKHGVQFQDSAISAYATTEQVGYILDRLIHAIQSIGFFVYHRPYLVQPVYQNDVEEIPTD